MIFLKKRTAAFFVLMLSLAGSGFPSLGFSEKDPSGFFDGPISAGAKTAAQPVKPLKGLAGEEEALKEETPEEDLEKSESYE